MRALCECRNMENIAQTLIDKLGGIDAVANATGVDKSRVYRWTYPQERGGTGGDIPRKHWSNLIIAARNKGIELTHSDFFQLPTPQPRRRKP